MPDVVVLLARGETARFDRSLRACMLSLVFGIVGCADEVPIEQDPSSETAPTPLPVIETLAEQVTLTVTRDTSLRSTARNSNEGTALTLSGTRAVLAVDGLDTTVGPQDVVLSAVLRLTPPTSGEPATTILGAYRLNKSWTELGATYACAIDGNTANGAADCAGATAWSMDMLPPNPWLNPATSKVAIARGRTTPVDLDVTRDVKAFLREGVANQGWVLLSGIAAVINARTSSASSTDSQNELSSEAQSLTLNTTFQSRESGAPPVLILSVRRCGAEACDDGNACTVDECDAQGYCTNEPASNGAACDDGDVCTLGDQCTNASCTSGSVIACGPEAKVVLNELESSGGAPDDWIELYNAGTRTVDLAGWSLRDNDDTHVYNLPAGSTLAPASYLVVEAAQLDFGLGGEDSARLFDVRTQPVDSYAWTAHAGVTYARCPDGSGAFANATSSTKGSANDCSTPPVAQVLINEVESNGGDPDDWIELHNAGSAPADLSGWSLRDNDDTHVYTLPAGSVIAPAGYLVIGQPTLGFGLGSEDAARLFQGSALIDSTSWTSHAAVTYGRCPNASGPFLNTSASTKGAANDCTPSGVPFTSWPGGDSVVDADLADTFADNVSGLSYEPALDVLWAVQNDPARLYRLEWAGSAWVPSAGDWAAGKALHYPGGAGAPDAEGVSRGEGSGLYVASERDNSDDGVSRMSVLRFDTASGGTSLTATHEWNLTPDLPPSGANAGLEAVAWVPDADLTARGFRDQSTGAAYDPTSYPAHGGGVFFVGLESAGTIFGYVLDHAGGGFTRVSSAPSGQPLTTDLAYDRDVGQLWAYCDDACGNRGTVLRIEEAASANQGAFTVRAGYERPANMPNYANEGIALGSEAQCAGGNKPFLWADDADTDGISIRSGTVRCGPLP